MNYFANAHRLARAMTHLIDPRIVNSLIDAHVLDRTGGPDDDIVDEILSLAAEEEINLLLPYSVKSEIEHHNTPAKVKRRAAELLYTEPVSLTPGEKEQHRRVREILQGNAKLGKHDRDAFHVVESAKYGEYFITNDQRILQKAPEIVAAVGIGIVTPAQFLTTYRCYASEPM